MAKFKSDLTDAERRFIERLRAMENRGGQHSFVACWHGGKWTIGASGVAGGGFQEETGLTFADAWDAHDRRMAEFANLVRGGGADGQRR